MIQKYGFWFPLKRIYQSEKWIVTILIIIFLTLIYLFLAFS
jgi:hypothetical protein